jgi:thiosulfate reductase cytochrome b subunit
MLHNVSLITAIIFMGMGSVLTGLAIYKPVQFSWATFLCGGYQAARLEHFMLTIGYVLFFPDSPVPGN